MSGRLCTRELVQMIYVEMSGRCGNQLFKYAAGRKMQILFNKKLVLNFHSINKRIAKDELYWENSLNHFNVSKYELLDSKKWMIYVHGNVLQQSAITIQRLLGKIPYKNKSIFYRRQIAVQPIMSKLGVYHLNRGYSPIKKPLFTNIFCRGTFEDIRWFDDIKETLQHELQPHYPELSKNKYLYDLIRTRNSVCVSIRRGDFLLDKYKSEKNVCTHDYYVEAIQTIKELIDNPIFIIFSDEIAWVKENYLFDCECIYEDGTDPIWEKLRLMYTCKHFIVSNSTFSWWAQYLSRSSNKIVVSPSRWTANAEYKHSLISDDWILI